MLSVSPNYSYSYLPPVQAQTGSLMEIAPTGTAGTQGVPQLPTLSQYPGVEMMRQLLGQVMQFTLAVIDKIVGFFTGQRLEGHPLSNPSTATTLQSNGTTFGTQLDQVITNASSTWDSLQGLFDFSKDGLLAKTLDRAASMFGGSGALNAVKKLLV
ncbi:MAG: hypothetical protein K1X83_07805 [Oligoflexia bacterium]|nr:hypothetical protein [Oligoflexia bacterium]